MCYEYHNEQTMYIIIHNKHVTYYTYPSFILGNLLHFQIKQSCWMFRKQNEFNPDHKLYCYGAEQD